MPGSGNRRQIYKRLEDAYQSTRKAFEPTTRAKSLRAPLRSTTSFRPYYSPKCDPKLNYTLHITENENNILHERVTQKIRARDKETLWMSYMAPLKVHPKAIVREWCKNRVKVAVKEALREQGFDHEGRLVGSDRDHTDQRGLKGSLRLAVTRNVLTTAWPDVKEDARRLVDGLLAQQTRSAGG